MYQPGSYAVALVFMAISMLSWGSWANTVKATRNWPFPLLYWDYTIGVVGAALIYGLTLGTIDGGPESFIANLSAADGKAMILAIAGGAIFNVANLLLVAAIEVAGLAVAFPIGIGLALVVGVIWSYVIAPQGHVLLLFGGVALVAAAIVVDAIAYRLRDDGAAGGGAKGNTRKGIQLSLLCGVLMGSFFPLVAHAGAGETGLGPYALLFVFSIGVALSTILFNSILMKRPITDAPPVAFSDYGKTSLANHLWGCLGGMIWCTGAMASFVGAHSALVGPATSYAMGQGATMVSALWGVFVWREFSKAPAKSRRLLAPMFVLFIAGLLTIAVAPLYGN
jgi:glucose uptake protein